MEKTPEGLGPRPADPAEGVVPLSPQRLQILQALHRTGPNTVSTLAETTGLHVNTVREHVEGLLDLGLVERERLPSAGRGRPAWQYSARAGAPSTSAGDHAALAAALAGHIARTSPSPAEDAAIAGQDWGRALASGRPASGTPLQARWDVVGLLGAAGFAPRPDDEARTVQLRRCPILDVARRYPQVVCNVHRGLVTAALEALGDPDGARRVELDPFAVPGACLLRLGTGTRAS